MGRDNDDVDNGSVVVVVGWFVVREMVLLLLMEVRVIGAPL